MRREEYEVLQSQVMMIAGLLQQLDLSGFITDIALAEAAGPILDPTAFRDAADNLLLIRDVAHALAEAQSKVTKAYERHPHVRAAGGLVQFRTMVESGGRS